MDLFEALLVLEGLTVEQTLDKFVPQGISENTIIEVIKNDPTSKYEGGKAGDYSQWILQKIKRGEKPTELLYKNLATFDKAKRKKNFDGKKNIMDYKTLEEFNSFMSDSNVEEMTEVELRTGIKPLFKGSKYTLYMPKTYEESKDLRGDDAIWCTGDPRSDYHWKNYTQNMGEDLIIFYDNSTNQPAYQAGIKRTTGLVKQFMDPRDHSADYNSIVPEDIKNFINSYYEERKTRLTPVYKNNEYQLFQVKNNDESEILIEIMNAYPHLSSNGRDDVFILTSNKDNSWKAVAINRLLGTVRTAESGVKGDLARDYNIDYEQNFPADVKEFIKSKYSNIELPVQPIFEGKTFKVYQVENQEQADTLLGKNDYLWEEFGKKEKYDILFLLSIQSSIIYWLIIDSDIGNIVSIFNGNGNSLEIQNINKTIPDDVWKFLTDKYSNSPIDAFESFQIFGDNQCRLYKIGTREQFDKVIDFSACYFKRSPKYLFADARNWGCNLFLMIPKDIKKSAWWILVNKTSGRIISCEDFYGENVLRDNLNEIIPKKVIDLISFTPELNIKPVFSNEDYHIFIPSSAKEAKVFFEQFPENDSKGQWIDFERTYNNNEYAFLMTDMDYSLLYIGELNKDKKLKFIESVSPNSDYYSKVLRDSTVRSVVSEAGLLEEVPCYYTLSNVYTQVYVNITTEAQMLSLCFGDVSFRGRDRYIILVDYYNDDYQLLPAVIKNGKCVLQDEDDLSYGIARNYKEELGAIGITESAEGLPMLRKEDVKGVDSLSKEQAQKLPESIRACKIKGEWGLSRGDAWWTKTPVPAEELNRIPPREVGLFGWTPEKIEELSNKFVYACLGDGQIVPKKIDDYLGVRTIITLSDNNSIKDVTVGQEVLAFGTIFIKLSDNTLIQRAPIHSTRFDKDSNDYSTSWLKHRVGFYLEDKNIYCWKK